MSHTRIEASGPHPDLEDEQAFLDHAYACLRVMHDRAVHLKGLGYLGGDVHADTGLTPEAAAAWEADKQRRIDLLADAPSALCFGRIDRMDDNRFYIGRRHVEDDDSQVVVADWRAPVAMPFYRATVADAMGVRLRRRFLVDGRELVDIFDEDLNDPTTLTGAYVPDPLLAEVERARTGEMRDIVATIQAEQDVIIRAPLEECIVVQGGPGTGKTAVGLHRAAFLLYEHRDLLERHRLLVVGPNRIFLRYIAQVLPSLGETASIQLTVEGLSGARFRVSGEDPEAVARLKGDARMAQVVRRGVFDHVSTPSADVRIGTGFGTVVLPADAVTNVIESALGRTRPLAQGRTAVRDQILQLAWRVHSSKATSDVSQQESFLADVRSRRDFKAALDKAWPALSAAVVIRRLLAGGPLLDRAGDGILSQDERDSLRRKPTGRINDERWTRPDLALLDEADALISGVGTTYGHVVVDEAQDLSAMELRMIARRSRRTSLTVLGDLAQATSPAAQTDWAHAIEQLAAPEPRLQELTVGYRVPAPIMDFANRLLAEAAPSLRPPTSVRLRGEAPRVVAAAADARAATVVSEVADLAAAWTSTGVVAPPALLDEIDEALGRAELAHADSRKSLELGDRVTLLVPAAVKGLEFDCVLVVEPARIVREEPNGLRVLYVALTRAVQRLTVVHSEPLPAALGSSAGADANPAGRVA